MTLVALLLSVLSLDLLEQAALGKVPPTAGAGLGKLEGPSKSIRCVVWCL